MLEGEQEEERKREAEKKQKKEKEKLLKQRHEMEAKLFGDPGNSQHIFIVFLFWCCICTQESESWSRSVLNNNYESIVGDMY